MALLLLIPSALIAARGPENLRQPATIGTIGLVIAAQGVFMWANRGLVTPFTKAQRLFMRGDLEAACQILEQLYDEGKANMQAMTLLGNTYRQLGRIEESHKVLYEALNKTPNHYFPLYGFGRTLLIEGHYAEAANMIEQALQNGGPQVIQYDAGEAHYRQGNYAQAIAFLQAAQMYLDDEPHRALMAVHLLYQMDAGDPPSASMIDMGIQYWRSQAELYAHTAYGQALAADIGLILG